MGQELISIPGDHLHSQPKFWFGDTVLVDGLKGVVYGLRLAPRDYGSTWSYYVLFDGCDYLNSYGEVRIQKLQEAHHENPYL